MASPRQRAARWRYVQYAVLVVALLLAAANPAARSARSVTVSGAG